MMSFRLKTFVGHRETCSRVAVIMVIAVLVAAPVNAAPVEVRFPEAELVEVLGRVGFTDVRIVKRFDCFKDTSKERIARKYGVRGANVIARRPG